MNSSENLISLIEDMLDKCIDTIAKNVQDSQDRNEYFKILEKSVHEYSNMDIKHKHLQKIIKESLEECLENNEININEMFQKNSNSIKHENDDTEIESHQVIKNFRNKTSKLIDVNEDSSPAMGSNNTPSLPLDPITQVPIINPIKNKHCGHLYEKSSIKKMLAKKKKMRCPYIGCASQNYFIYADLDENMLFQEVTDNLEINEHNDETL